MRNDQSTFIKELGYLIDEFDELQDMRWSDLEYLAEYRELKMKKNDGLPIDQNRLDELEPRFKNKIVTAARWNKFQNALLGMQNFIKNEVEGFVLDKQQEINTTVIDSQNAINTIKDNALISIENKKENIIDYMDQTTAGALRNDIGVMGDSVVEGRSLVDKTNSLKSEIDGLAGVGRTIETVKSAYDLAKQAFQSASDGKQKIATAITGKGVPTSSSDTFTKMASNIDAIETDKTGDATAVAMDILLGKVAYAKGQRIVGTMPNYGDKIYTPSDAVQTGGAGFYNSIKVNPRPALSGTADPANVLAGKYFYKNSYSRQLGTMPNRGAPAQTLTTQGGQYNLPSGYYTGGYVKAQFANLVAGNIKKGVNIGGVVGTLLDGTNMYNYKYGTGKFVDPSSSNIAFVQISTDRIPKLLVCIWGNEMQSLLWSDLYIGDPKWISVPFNPGIVYYISHDSNNFYGRSRAINTGYYEYINNTGIRLQAIGSTSDNNPSVGDSYKYFIFY